MGISLGHLSWNTEYGTQHCPHNAIGEQFRCVTATKMELKIHLEDTCPLKSKKGPQADCSVLWIFENNYTLLWDMKSNEGYINVVSVMQKFFDQAISGNWSYNPEHYENNEVPVSVMANDFLTTYNMVGKLLLPKHI